MADRRLSRGIVMWRKELRESREKGKSVFNTFSFFDFLIHILQIFEFVKCVVSTDYFAVFYIEGFVCVGGTYVGGVF